jgi:hypothetical protein
MEGAPWGYTQILTLWHAYYIPILIGATNLIPVGMVNEMKLTINSGNQKAYYVHTLEHHHFIDTMHSPIYQTKTGVKTLLKYGTTNSTQ